MYKIGSVIRNLLYKNCLSPIKLLSNTYTIKRFRTMQCIAPPKFQWNKINLQNIFTHKRNRFGMTKHWRKKRKKVLIRKSLIPWRPEKKVVRTYKMPKERRVFKVGWGEGKKRKGGRMLKISRQR